MSLGNFNASLFANARENGYYIKGGGYMIPFDLILSERHHMDTEVATHPIDGDQELATHLRNKLREGEFEAIISNWSINRPMFISKAPSVFLGLGGGNNAAKGAYETLRDLWEARILVDIILNLEVYSSCAIVAIETARDKQSGDAQKFNIRFRQIKVAQLAKTKLNAAVSVADTNGDTSRQTLPNEDMGSVTSGN